MSASAIEFQGIQKRFGLAFSLGPLTLTVPRGSIYALIGPNGAGKSTALNMLMGMGEPTRGSVKVLDRDIREDEVEIKRRTAYVSPDMDYRAWGTVGRAIDFVRGFYPDWDASRCDELQFVFDVHRDIRVDALSFGGRMKLALVLALSRDAELLVLDEPTLGLDAIVRRQLFTELLKFMSRDGRTILISSHQLTDLERFADHAAIVNQGKLLTSGRMDKLVERYRQFDARILCDTPLGVPGVSVIDRQGDRVRLLVDGDVVSANPLEMPRFAGTAPPPDGGAAPQKHGFCVLGPDLSAHLDTCLSWSHGRELERSIRPLYLDAMALAGSGCRPLRHRLFRLGASAAYGHSPFQQRECFFAGLSKIEA